MTPSSYGLPVDDVEAMQVLQSTQQLGRVKPTPQLVEFPLSL